MSDPVQPPLRPGETLLWRGRIGFTVLSHPAMVALLSGLAVYAVLQTWLHQPYSEFCPPPRPGRLCASTYWILPACLVLVALSQGFDAVERLLVTTGRARGEVLISDQRRIRISDWPWPRVRSIDYRERRPDWGLPGVIRFGRSSVILSPTDADACLRIMDRQRRSAR